MKKVLVFLFICTICGQSYAIDPGDINCSDNLTWCAKSCNVGDVQAAVDGALSSGKGDTVVYIPPCQTTWSAGSKVNIDTGNNKSIRIIGSGQTSTKIKNFQFGIPTSYVTHISEWGHMTVYADNNAIAVMSGRMRSSSPGRIIYWHDLTVLDYNVYYPIHLEGWTGLITRLNMRCVDNPNGQNSYGITIHGNGTYSNHKSQIGAGNALFVEDSNFDYCSHTISLFCNAYAVFRYNTVNHADSYLDIHGPNYNYCAPIYGVKSPNDKHSGGGFEVYNNTFNNSQSSWLVSPRAGTALIIANNKVGTSGQEKYFVALQSDPNCCDASIGCGGATGETCNRKYTIGSDQGCLQMPENYYYWNNTCSKCVNEAYYYDSNLCASPCFRENVDFFNRAPSQALDGFTWTPYTYPYPIPVSFKIPGSATNFRVDPK